MKQFFFIIAFIWFLTSIGSLVIGPFVGIDRKRLKIELIDYWKRQSPSATALFARRVALAFSWVGFLFPVIFPIPGLFAALVFSLLT